MDSFGQFAASAISDDARTGRVHDSLIGIGECLEQRRDGVRVVRIRCIDDGVRGACRIDDDLSVEQRAYPWRHPALA